MTVHPNFARAVEALPPSFGRLFAAPTNVIGNFSHSKRLSGVYLFSERDLPLYVGRSDHIRRRYSQHTGLGSRPNDAPFAFLLAREELGIQRAYSGRNVRSELAKDAAFKAAFSRAKERIRQMQFRFVEEDDPLQQMLLETYCAVALSTPYNSFRNT
jgi:hypothetical protein